MFPSIPCRALRQVFCVFSILPSGHYLASFLVRTHPIGKLDILSIRAKIHYVCNRYVTKKAMENKVKNGPTKSQMEFIEKNLIKNCEYFTRLTRKPDFMAKVKQLQEKDELPMTPDSCFDLCKRVCSALVLFRFEKLPEVVLKNSEDLMNNPQMKRDLDMAKVHSLLRLLHKDQIKEYSPTKETGLPAFLVPPVTGLSEMPPSQVVVSGFKFMMENLNHIVLSLRGEQPLPEEIPAELEALGFPYFNKEYWQRLCRGQGLNKKSRARGREIAKISQTKSDGNMTLYIYTS